MSRRRGAGRRRRAACALVLTASASAGGAAPAVPRIVGGGKANAAGWQFTVALDQKRRFICSGSLIAPSQVLTAAHCVKGGKRNSSPSWPAVPGSRRTGAGRGSR